MASFSGLMRVFVHRTAAPEGTLHDTADTDKCRTVVDEGPPCVIYRKTLIFQHQPFTCAFLDWSILDLVYIFTRKLRKRPKNVTNILTHTWSTK